MRRNLLTGAVIVLALAASGAAAFSQPRTPPADVAAPDADPLATQSDDWAGYAHVGYHLDPHWRLELQGGYHTDVTSPALAPGEGLSPCADPLASLACGPRDVGLGAYSMVANLVFDTAPESRWVDPFFSIGAGVNRFDSSPIAMTNPAMHLLQMGQNSAELGYQALIGLAFRPHDRLHFDLSYRWMSGMAPTLNGDPEALSGRFQDQTVAITVRYALSLPKLAVAPAPSLGLASSEALASFPPRLDERRTVVVATTANPAALSNEAEAAVGQTALSASEGRGSQVVVDGHADTIGAAKYNRRLTERRAKAMADAMVSLGVPVSAMDVSWTGGEADGVTLRPADVAQQARAELPSAH
jgi:opacity protein-like surface antigen